MDRQKILMIFGVAWLSGLMYISLAITMWFIARRHASPLVAAPVTVVAILAAADGMSMRPQNEVGGGTWFKDTQLKLANQFDTDVSTLEFAKLLSQNGMSASGTHKATVTLVCPGN